MLQMPHIFAAVLTIKTTVEIETHNTKKTT